MIIRPRVIPCLLMNDRSLVKTRLFDKEVYLGDPINAVKIYNEKEVDELCLLDITATVDHKRPDFEILEEIASEAFMPLSYGGGIHSVEDAQEIFRIGFEKIIFNSALITEPELVKGVIELFGSQSIIASIDCKKTIFGKENCYIYKGRKSTKKEPVEMAELARDIGVGEILLNDIDRDGMMCGYNLERIHKVSNAVDIPVICCGGAGNLHDLYLGIKEGGASAVAAGSIFVFWGNEKAVLINFPSEEELLKEGVYYEERISDM